MSRQPQTDDKPSGRQAGKLLQSGIIFSAISFLTGLGNLAFQGVMGRHLKASGDYGSANSALNGFMPLLGLLPAVAIFAVTHYIAHFNASGDSARLQGLLLGCRKSLFRLTIAGSALAIVLVKPLSAFFHYNESLMLVTLGCTLLGLWAALATALCQGLAWFKRLALIGFLGMTLRVLFGWFITLKWPSAETAVLATGFALLANLILLFWRKDLSLHGAPVSPWSREFVQYVVVSAAFVVGSYCFTQGDLLVMQHYFSGGDRDAYAVAERLAFALPSTVGPLLAVLFTSRSGERGGNAVREQFKLLGLYVIGLAAGVVGLLLLRDFLVKLILGTPSAAAAEMISRLAITMAFASLLQALGTWALASRWIKISLLYGGLGIGYWLALLFLGKSPADLLRVMPVAAGTAFTALFLVWLVAMRTHKIGKPAQG
jgi:O-antigen/teichoic acid export membrane protein